MVAAGNEHVHRDRLPGAVLQPWIARESHRVLSRLAAAEKRASMSCQRAKGW